MEAGDREGEAARIAADLVQRDEAIPAVEGRVLDTLRVHGRRRLLEADDERVVPALLEQQDPRQLGRQAGLLDGGSIGVRDEPRVRLDVGAVDVERGERLLDVGVEGELRGELRRLLGEGRRRLLQLRLAATSAKERRSPVSSSYSRVSGTSAAGSTKSAVTSLRNS